MAFEHMESAIELKVHSCQPALEYTQSVLDL